MTKHKSRLTPEAERELVGFAGAFDRSEFGRFENALKKPNLAAIAGERGVSVAHLNPALARSLSKALLHKVWESAHPLARGDSGALVDRIVRGMTGGQGAGGAGRVKLDDGIFLSPMPLHFTPKGHWAEEVAFKMGPSGVKEDLAGQCVRFKYGPNEVMSAVIRAFKAEDHVFPAESFRLSGASPNEIQALSAEEINSGPSARVFDLRARVPAGGRSIILNVCNDTEGSKPHGHLRDQYRTMLFFKFNLPPSVRDMGALVTPQLRRRFTLRSDCPPELVEPYLETYGTAGGERIYMFTAEKASGSELVRFGGNFEIRVGAGNETLPTTDEESLAISKEIIRVYSQLFACMFNPGTEEGFVPTHIQILNGDVVIEPKNLLQPKIRLISVMDTSYGGPEGFIDEMLAPRNYLDRSRQYGWIIKPTVENLPHIVEAIKDGIRPVFPGREEELAFGWLKAYADTQEREFDALAGKIREMVLSSGDLEELKARALGFLEAALYSRMSHNPIMGAELKDVLDRLSKTDRPSIETVDRFAEEVRPLVCPPQLIQAIRRM